jgi:hypothetical protein
VKVLVATFKAILWAKIAPPEPFVVLAALLPEKVEVPTVRVVVLIFPAAYTAPPPPELAVLPAKESPVRVALLLV